MLSRRGFLQRLSASLLAAPLVASAQEPGKVWRIGFLSPYSTNHLKRQLASLRQGLRDVGYMEGQNLVIEQRHAGGRVDKLADLAAELIRLKMDVVVAHGDSAPPAMQAARQAGSAVPIVMVANPDPVGTGLVASLARPGGNVTGLSDLHSALAAKRLELLKEVAPSASRVAVLLNPTTATHPVQFKDLQGAARAARMTVFALEVREPDDVDQAFTTIRRERLEALNVLGGAAGIHRKRVADLAIKSRIPAITTTRDGAADGFLLTYGANFVELYRRAAFYVDKILKGAKPADLPVEQPTKFELVINLKTAKALGLTIPPSLLLRADQVIE